MKNLKDVITESSGKNLFNCVQFDTNADFAYSTFNIKEANKKYKKGFIDYFEDEEGVSITAFKDDDVIGDIADANVDLADLAIGETLQADDHIITRIW